MDNTPHIAVFLRTAYYSHINALRGILAYSRTHTTWSIDLRTGRADEKKQNDVDWSSYDGAIVHSMAISGAMLASLKQVRQRLPVILVSPYPVADFHGYMLTCDNAPIAASAAKHLISKNCAAYAFVHSTGQFWSDARGRLFAEAVKANGAKFLWRTSSTKSLTRLIADAPKPLGVFAATDILARATLDACHITGCRVPDDVLILGVDDDVSLCETSNPPLSSIPLQTYDAGYRVAEILDLAIQGKNTLGNMPIEFFTGGPVVERLSTARSFAYDMLVRRCREVLAQEFSAPIRVSALATRFRVSRRTLETHFRAVTGTTIAEEVTRLRIERAKHLLSTTDKTLTQIADKCGFYDISHFSATFLRHVGVRPTAFRTNSH